VKIFTARIVVAMCVILTTQKAACDSSRPVIGVLAATNGVISARDSTKPYPKTRVLTNGSKILFKDELTTGRGVKAQIILKDNSTFALGGEAKFVLDEFVYNPKQSNNHVGVTVAKGAFKFVSGKIAKKNNEAMKVKAGNAIIAVRGTEVLGTVSTEGNSLYLLSGAIDVQSLSMDCTATQSISNPFPIETDGSLSTMSLMRANAPGDCLRTISRPGLMVTSNSAGLISEPFRADPTAIDNLLDSVTIREETNDPQSASESEDPQDDTTQDDTTQDDTTQDDTTQDDTTRDQSTETNSLAQEEAEPVDKASDSATSSTRSQDSAAPSESQSSSLATNDGQSIQISADNQVIDDGAERTSETEMTEYGSRFDLLLLESIGTTEETQTSELPELTPGTQALSPNLASVIGEVQVSNEDDGNVENNDLTLTTEVNIPTTEMNSDLETAVDSSAVFRTIAEVQNNDELEELSEEVINSYALTLPATSPYIDTASNDSFNSQEGSASVPASPIPTVFNINGAAADTSVAGFDQSLSGNFGSLFVNSSSGAFAYFPNDGVINQLNSSDGQQTDQFVFTATNGISTDSQVLAISIQSGNDQPEVLVTALAAIADTAALDTFSNIIGSATGSDRDSEASLTFSIDGASANTNLAGFDLSKSSSYGELFINSSSGAYVYVPNQSTVNALGPGTSASDSFVISVSDGTLSNTQTLTTSVTGANDSPTLSISALAAIVDTTASDNFATQAASASGADADGDALTYNISGANTGSYLGGAYDRKRDGAFGTLYINSISGAYEFVPDDNAINALNDGDSGSDTFTVSVTDGTVTETQTLTASITGANEAPTPTLSVSALTAYTDTSSSDNFAAQTASASGANFVGGSLTYGISGANTGSYLAGAYDRKRDGSYGTLYINSSSGAYEFVPDDTAINALADGVLGQDTFTVSVSDGTVTETQTLTASSTGANDAPTFSLGAISAYAEDTAANDTAGFTTKTAQVSSVSDAESNGVIFSISGGIGSSTEPGYTDSLAGNYGTLHIDAVGNYQYVPDTDQMQAISTTYTESFDISGTDGTDSTTETLSFSVTGENDTPIFSNRSFGSWPRIAIPGTNWTGSANSDLTSTVTDRDTDASGQSSQLRLTKVRGPSWLTVSSDRQSVTGSPNGIGSEAVGQSLQLELTHEDDGGAVSSSQTFYITICDSVLNCFNSAVDQDAAITDVTAAEFRGAAEDIFGGLSSQFMPKNSNSYNVLKESGLTGTFSGTSITELSGVSGSGDSLSTTQTVDINFGTEKADVTVTGSINGIQKEGAFASGWVDGLPHTFSHTFPQLDVQSDAIGSNLIFEQEASVQVLEGNRNDIDIKSAFGLYETRFSGGNPAVIGYVGVYSDGHAAETDTLRDLNDSDGDGTPEQQVINLNPQ